MRYPSVAAFVDEVRVIPPIARAQSATTVITSAGFTTTVESTWTYDAQNRLVQRYESNLGSTTIFTAWDASGRPTAAHFATSSDTYTLVYNDAARSATSTATSPSSGVQGVTTTVYDTNGNPVSSNMTTATPLGQFVTSIIYSTSTTRQVCS